MRLMTPIFRTCCKFRSCDVLCPCANCVYGLIIWGYTIEYEHDPLDPDHVSVLRKIQQGDIGLLFCFPTTSGDEEVVMMLPRVFLRRVCEDLRNVYDVGPVSIGFMQTASVLCALY